MCLILLLLPFRFAYPPPEKTAFSLHHSITPSCFPRAVRILDDLAVAEEDQPFLNHLFQERQEAADAFFGIHDLDLDRKIGGDIQQRGAMNTAVCAISLDALQDGRAGQSLLPGALNNGI